MIASLMVAAEAIGISRYTVWSAIKADPEFAEAVELAELAACEPVEDALREAATSGNVPAIQTWLYNRGRGRWRPATEKHELTGKDGGPIVHKHDLSSLSDEELAALEGIARKLNGPADN